MQEAPRPSPDLPGEISPVTGPNAVPRDVVAELTGTLPWVLLIATLSGLAGVAAILLSGWMIGVTIHRGGDTGAALHAAIFGLFIYAPLFLLPAWRLWRFGAFITRLKSSRATPDFEMALQSQRQFWKLVAFVVLTLVAVMILSFFGLLVAVTA